MPKYTFLCSDCSKSQNMTLSIEQYRSLGDSNYFCNRCGSTKLRRIFSSIHSSTQQDKEDFLEDIRGEVLKTVEKINSGDISSIVDIYGEEINKLKIKD